MCAANASNRNSRYGGNHFSFGAARNSVAAYDTPANQLNLDARTTAPFPKRTQLVGIESRQKSLVQLLMDEHLQKLRVISIFGFGGLGKTTLAMTTYRSLSAAIGSFQCQAFVTVSQRFDVKVLIDILLQIIPPVDRQGNNMSNGGGEASPEGPLKGMEAWNVSQLASMLRQQLENKRYLLVLDDIWSIVAWEGVRFSLPDSNNGSRVVVTTRIQAVAHSYCSNEYDKLMKLNLSLITNPETLSLKENLAARLNVLRT